MAEDKESLAKQLKQKKQELHTLVTGLQAKDEQIKHLSSLLKQEQKDKNDTALQLQHMTQVHESRHGSALLDFSLELILLSDMSRRRRPNVNERSVMIRLIFFSCKKSASNRRGRLKRFEKSWTPKGEKRSSLRIELKWPSRTRV